MVVKKTFDVEDQDRISFYSAVFKQMKCKWWKFYNYRGMSKNRIITNVTVLKTHRYGIIYVICDFLWSLHQWQLC
jgi:hypothetical protein